MAMSIEIIEKWKLHYYKCERFTGFQLNWDGKDEFTLADAKGIGETILMLPARAVLKTLDMLQPVAKYFNISCSSGTNSIDWMLGSGLLWLLLIAAILQFTGWQVFDRKPNLG